MKTIFITGGTRGVGKALVKAFAYSGYNTLFCYKNSDDKARELELELSSLGFKVKGYKLDIADSMAVTNLFNNELKDTQIDALINNAGICLKQQLLVDTTINEWQQIFNTNVNGVFNVTKEVVKKMMFNGGSIINIGSMWGNVGGSCEVCYSASKGAINSFTLALAKELASSKIRVNCIALGVIDTDMNAHLTKEDMKELESLTPLGRIGKPEDITNLALLLCEDNSFITGQIITVDGGFTL